MQENNETTETTNKNIENMQENNETTNKNIGKLQENNQIHESIGKMQENNPKVNENIGKIGKPPISKSMKIRKNMKIRFAGFIGAMNSFKK